LTTDTKVSFNKGIQDKRSPRCPKNHWAIAFPKTTHLRGKDSSMIPTPQTGKMKKLDPETFQAKGWQLVTDNQAIKSILKAISVNDDNYRCVYVLTGVDDTLVSTSASTSVLEVWAGWHQVPSNGSAFVCLYDRGTA
jgi:hypothetical protein